MSFRSLKMHFSDRQVKMERLWWADNVLFLRLACQNTHAIKRLRSLRPRDFPLFNCTSSFMRSANVSVFISITAHVVLSMVLNHCK